MSEKEIALALVGAFITLAWAMEGIDEEKLSESEIGRIIHEATEEA